jgi:hypothetical protein
MRSLVTSRLTQNARAPEARADRRSDMRRSLAWLVLFLLLVAQSPPASAIFASPVQAGCYIAAANDCRVHVDPFTVELAPGTKLVDVRLVLVPQGPGTQTTVYDWRPDQSNPAPSIGSTYSPSIPSQDLGAS